MIFLLRCPHCHNAMKYHTDDRILTDKRKQCVYCPKNFGVRKNMISTSSQ